MAGVREDLGGGRPGGFVLIGPHRTGRWVVEGTGTEAQRDQLRGDPGTVALVPAPHLLAPPVFFFSVSELKAVAHHTKCIYEVVISFPMFY